jgi:hypothetical protein
VNLQDQSSVEFCLMKAMIEPHKSEFEYVGGESLDTGVHGLSFRRLALRATGGGEISERPNAPKFGA